MKNDTKTVLKLLCSPIEADWMIAKILVDDDFELSWYIQCLYLYERSYGGAEGQDKFFKSYKDRYFHEYFNYLGNYHTTLACPLDVILNELSYE